MDHDNIVLSMKNIRKVFPGVCALDQVHFELRKGEVHALIGENGAGKSTLMKILLGIHSADAGEIIYKGKSVSFHNPNQALNSGISMIHQEISLVQSMDVAENIWLGREHKFRKFGLLDVRARYEATEKILKSLNIDLNPKSKVKDLSVASMQLIEVARAVSYNSDIVIMDEPTSALTSVEIETLYAIIRSLAAKGVSIIFISHKLDEIYEICDRITVLRDGRFVVTKPCSELPQSDLVTYIAGREVSEMFPKVAAEIKGPVMEVRHLNRTGVVNDVSFEVRAGEILGFSGLMGAGRTEIMRAIFGIDRKTSGEILIDGKPVKIRDPQDALRCGLGMVTEDRLRMGSIYQLSVMANTTIAYFKWICNRLGFFRLKSEAKAFDSIAGRMSIKYSSPKEKISQLSGGNQQKVILSRWLLTNPKVLILDEPTRGIDVGSKAEIHRTISSLAAEGMAIILVSSELPEIMGMSDRIMVVRGGRIVYECSRQEATQEELIAQAFGTVS